MKVFIYPPTPISVSVPPVQYSLDGAVTGVSRNTVTPANSRPLPVINLDSSGNVASPLSNAELRAAPVPISGALTDTQIRATPLPISGSVSTGGLTDAQIRASSLPVIGPLTDTQLRATPVPISGSVNTGGLTDTQLRATPLPFSAAALPLPTGAATESTLAGQNALYGALAETVPASDTASSGINGRLQRIAQRLTSLIALFPSSIGQKVKTDSISVTIASDQTTFPVTSNVVDVTASGNITTQNLVPAGAATAGSAVEIVLSGHGTTTVQVTGTYTGALSVQATVDGTSWVTLSGMLNCNTGALLATITSALQGIFQLESSGFNRIRITGLAAMTGTASISLRGSRTSAMVGLDSPLPAGSNGIGSVTISGTPSVVSTSTRATIAGTVTNAKVTVGLTAIRATVAGTAPNAARKRLILSPDQNNTGRIFMGASTVTVANGLEVIGPDRLDFEFDSGDYFLISDIAAQSVSIVEKV